MKNAVIMLLILIFSILIYGIVQLKKNDTPIVNTPAASSTIQNHLPQPDYSEAVMPEDKLPESEEVIVINEEQK